MSPDCDNAGPLHSGITLGNVIAEIKQQMWWYFYKPVTCEWKDSSFQLCFRQTANIVLLVPVGCICKLFLNLEEVLLEDSFVLISVWCPSVQWPPNTGHQLTPGCCCCCPSIGIRISQRRQTGTGIFGDRWASGDNHAYLGVKELNPETLYICWLNFAGWKNSILRSWLDEDKSVYLRGIQSPVVFMNPGRRVVAFLGSGCCLAARVYSGNHESESSNHNPNLQFPVPADWIPPAPSGGHSIYISSIL